MHSKPNILIIVTDQQNLDAISAYRKHFKHKAWHCHWIKTPHLDKLVSEGYSFLESHSTNPVCCPARSSLFTGRYSTETGVTYNNVGIAKEIPNMGEWFGQQGGYHTVYCGKWHAGGAWNYPETEGNRKIPGFETLPVAAQHSGDINDFQVSASVAGYITNYKGEKPFLLVAGLMNPHDICYWIPKLNGKKLVPETDRFELGDTRPPLPPNFAFNFTDPYPIDQVESSEEQWRNYLYDYQRMVEKADADVGRMMAAVNLRHEPTLVLFTSDHGEGSARHKRVQKWHPFDEAMKVPLIFSMQSGIKKGRIDRNHLASGIDIMPTLCDFAGIPAPPNCLGKSLKPLITGQKTEQTYDTVFAEFQHTGRMVRHKNYKYIKIYEYSRMPDAPFVRTADGQPERFVQGAETGRYKVRPQRWLFDLKADPWETTNLADDAQFTDTLALCDQLLTTEWEAKVIPGNHFER